ncbi:helix-turn-helix domain-containing protein [Siminovitchia fordii]|uniref:HTH cro/C1-type domain-containing protein n=1 Tax=Siminovitchia fordii TaxID=254759 RepID=A0ABQ4K0X0_9BACI|nr:helix-turn-helix transcriptional regulator [Siminovitchia fordii]GIN19405.1 hypothetical protein J1TS3_05390 [Siminovitchia fordii]
MDHWKVKYMGETIKRLRMRNYFSQEDLAWRSFLDRKTINRLETNQQEPLASTISALAAAFEMDLSEFMKEVEDDILRKKDSKNK